MFLFIIFQDNLASKKPTWQIPSISIYPPERVVHVDNLKSNRSAAGNQCAISDGTPHGAIWMVDLQSIQVINNIMIYYRTEDKTWSKTLSILDLIVHIFT